MQIIKKGYYVLRMGDPLMRPINIHDNFIDYVHTPQYSNLLDLYIYRHCSFWIGSPGGARCAAVFYKIPSVVVNVTALAMPISSVCLNREDVIIFKHIFSVCECRLLSLKEQLQRVREIVADINSKSGNYVLIENSPEEISQAFLEWHEDRTTQSFDWNSCLQEEYHDLRQRSCRDAYFNFNKNEWDETYIEQFYHLRPRLGKQFLENCFEYGEYLSRLTQQYKKIRECYVNEV